MKCLDFGICPNPPTHIQSTQESTYPVFQLVRCPYPSLSFFLFQVLKVICTGILWEEEFHGKYYQLQFLLQLQWKFTQRTCSLWTSCLIEIPPLDTLIIMLHLELQLKYNKQTRERACQKWPLVCHIAQSLSLTHPEYILFQDMKH